MTRDDVIRMACAAGWCGIYSNPLMSIRMYEGDFLKFANLVAAAEREACARVCEEGINANKYPSLSDCAAAIRARGGKK